MEGQTSKKRKGPARAEDPYGGGVRVKVKSAGPSPGLPGHPGPKKGRDTLEHLQHIEHFMCITPYSLLNDFMGGLFALFPIWGN